ncbi:hypothetical protein FN846DRAFT_985548 [Sphaerosporella brunnea]|uniref:ARID domain-containing protein n=1 Tax=Sphaerosporella brunnea TaxID=1250544 RepID=A0A5J5FA49_9PEZI|nr:hypothetical protein FN846DRAFT_985548 [Sphaerosporella brunnea]
MFRTILQNTPFARKLDVSIRKLDKVQRGTGATNLSIIAISGGGPYGLSYPSRSYSQIPDSTDNNPQTHGRVHAAVKRIKKFSRSTLSKLKSPGEAQNTSFQIDLISQFDTTEALVMQGLEELARPNALNEQMNFDSQFGDLTQAEDYAEEPETQAPYMRNVRLENVVASGRMFPNLFHCLLALCADELTGSQFHGTLYQFARQCWGDEIPPRPWVPSTLPAEYDPTDPSAGKFVSLHSLFLAVMRNGGSHLITHNAQWDYIGAIFGFEDGYIVYYLYNRYLLCYEVYSQMVKAFYWNIHPSTSRIRFGDSPRLTFLDGHRFVDLSKRPPRSYEAEREVLLAVIKKQSAEASDDLAFRYTDLTTEPPSSFARVKDVVYPEEAFDVYDRPQNYDLATIDGKVAANAFLHQAREGVTLGASRYVPPPQRILEQDESGYEFLDDERHQLNSFRDFYPASYATPTQSDAEELFAKFGIAPHKEEEEQVPDPELTFAEWFGMYGIEGAKLAWHEWIVSDIGMLHRVLQNVAAD